MSISIGGLGLVSLRNPFAELFGTILGKSDIKSIFCVVVFFIVSLVLAYLTNPSENSFRTYLTEQSFRQHLSRLDDVVDEDLATRTHPRSSLQYVAASGFSFPVGHSSPFHFANRASVSLRTPKHVFHSFGILTIAAIVPIAKSRSNDDRDGYMISDSWFIGAFGRWWRGGIIEDWYQDVVASSKDEESWSSGILGMKSLDMLHDYSSGLPFSAKNIPSSLYAKGSPPRLRNRDRVVQKPSVLPSRSTTPPPLPKSASLPLHTTRPSHLLHDHIAVPPAPLLQPTHSQVCPSIEPILTGSPAIIRSPSALFDQSPVIAEILHQISLSKTSTVDLRTQLTDFQLAASQSRTALQTELEAHRERKRQEDTSRLELKTRTKALEDSRRIAESSKRDAEKKLKVAQNARDGASQRMHHLGNEIALLQQRLLDDEVFIHQSQASVSEASQEMSKDLELKRREIKVAEDVIVALNLRARELEESISEEKKQLREMRERAEARKQEQIIYILHHQGPLNHWDPSYDSPNPVKEVSGDQGSSADISHNAYSVFTREHLPPIATDIPARMSTSHSAMVTRSSQSSKTFPIFEDGLGHSPPPKFSPFGDSDVSLVRTSPTGSSLIPSSLITSLDGVDGLSRSFQSENDAFMDKEWRTNIHPSSVINHQYSGFPTLSSSPVSLHGPNSHDHDPFEVRRLRGHDGRHNLLGIDNSVDTHFSWLHRTHSDPNPSSLDVEEPPALPLAVQKGGPRRWFSAKEKPRKGLNPDAKVFSLSRKSLPAARKGVGPISAYDALNPNGLGSTDNTSATSASSSLLRAFAPSPAEREALQRALGGSSNTSFERLPSLSDVGSIPSSPSHTHAHPVVHIPQHAAQEMGKVLPSWLQSLPKIRKPNFSPWDDDESMVGENGSSKEHRVHIKG